MKIAFYKAKDHLFNKAVSWWDQGPYSHCEFLGEHFGGNEYMCYSSSARDGGVRKKRIDLLPEKWDIVEVDGCEKSALNFFAAHEGAGYDYLGLVGFVVRLISGEKSRYFCSELVAAMIGYRDSWRFTPNSLACSLKRHCKLNATA